ncbi:MAG TPA: phosphopantetheine-binding protein [Thermoanaerobaculia bacterium]|nr:phosphopantetheine-binding protein [Thermoanaerobaculia bacterium]
MTDPVLEKIKRIVVEDLDVNLAYEDLDETVPLFEEGLALDSVILVELISFIEKRFDIELRDEALNMETFKNLQSVARVIREQIAQQQQV